MRHMFQSYPRPKNTFCQSSKKKIFQKTLEREAKKAAWLIIWTDGDREGENIGFEIIQVCQVRLTSNKYH